MQRNLINTMIAGLSFLLAGCGGTQVPPEVRAAGAVPAAEALAGPFDETVDAPSFEDKIGPSDVLSVIVYGEPEMSMSQVQVGRGGTLQMPIVGTVQAAGKTPAQLSVALADSLRGTIVNDPNVAVNIVAANSQKLTVEGAVREPGVYMLEPQTTLLTAVALAGGTTRVAKFSEVAVFRTDSVGRSVAVFDLAAIREGRMADPRLAPKDVVVIGFSGLKQAWQDFLQAVPALALFRRY